MSKIGKQVEALLEKYEICRNSDSNLIIGILHLNGLFLSHDDREKIRGIHFESITRERRKIQESKPGKPGRFLPTDPAVARKRRIKSYEIQQTAPSETPQGLQERIARND